MEIAKGLAKQNNYKGSDEILTDIVKFWLIFFFFGNLPMVSNSKYFKWNYNDHYN